MPPVLRGQLFGALTLWRVTPAGEERLPLPGGETLQSLLAYLLLYGQQPLPRLRLAGMFWPELPEAQALRRLSQALWKIRKAIPELLAIETGQVSLSPQIDWRCDVTDFTRLLEQAEEGEALLQATALYHGDLLEGLYADWVIAQREWLRERYLRGLGRLVEMAKLQGRLRSALEAGLRLLELDPLNEAVQREVMRLYLALGQPAAALKQYESCRAVLQAELGVAPEAETDELAAEMRRLMGEQERKAWQPTVPTYLPPVAAGGRAMAGQLPLVGREAERSQLLGWLEDALSGAGGMLILEGEAGVGKTRLLQEFARDAAWRGLQVIEGRFTQSGGAAAYQVLCEALQRGLTPLRRAQLTQLLCAADWQLVQNWLLQNQPSSSRSVEVINLSTQRLGHALGALLTAWGQVVPLLFVLEDLHWADSETLAVLRYAAPWLRSGRVLLVCSQRGDEIRLQAAQWSEIKEIIPHLLAPPLRLGCLEENACAELLRRCLGLKTTAPRFEARLYRETAGNPLFLLETLRTLMDAGLLTQTVDGEWETPWDPITQDYVELPLAAAVESAIARRLESLELSTRQLLQVAAVLGDGFEFDLLAAASGWPVGELFPGLVTLLQRQFLLEQAEQYHFSHDKVRQVVYQGLTDSERQSWHRRCGQAVLERFPERSTLLAWHFWQAHDWEPAARYSWLAGEQAADHYAFHEARQHYDRALIAWQRAAISPTARQLFDLHLRREQACNRLGDRLAQRQSLEALQTLLAEPGLETPSAALQVQQSWALYWYVLADYAQALSGISRWLTLAQEAGDLAAEFLAIIYRGRVLREQGEYPASQREFEGALELATRSGDQRAQAEALSEISALAFNAGDYGLAQHSAERGLPLARQSGDLALEGYLLGRLANIAHYLADFPKAIEYRWQSLEICRCLGDRNRELSELYNLSTCLADMGDYERARRTLLEVCQGAHQIGNRRVEGYGRVFLGLVLENLGDFPASQEAYQESLRLRQETGLHALAVDSLAGLARVATAQGDHAAAIAWADRVLIWMEAYGPDGVGDPLLAYLGAYRALLAAGETGRGLAGLRRAYRLLLQYADTIADPERRRAYLHEISPGKPIWEDYHRLFSRRITVSLAHESAPLGRPLRPEEWTPVTWTVEAPEDQEIADKGERRRQQLQRLVREAAEQHAVPTIADLAQALSVSPATLKRDLATLRRSGQLVRTRRGAA